MKVADLFSGAGGFSQGFKQAGHEIVLAVDIWETALKSFGANHTQAETFNYDIINGDIGVILEKIRSHGVDIIIGSPPCQPFSIANKNRDVIAGMAAVRRFFEIVNKARVKYYAMEETPAVAHHVEGMFILNAYDFGVPQKRKRAFKTNIPRGIRSKVRPGWEMPLSYMDGAKRKNNAWHDVKFGTLRTKKPYCPQLGRFWTIDEGKRYMGFPVDYILFGSETQQWRQLGNAVSPPVAEWLGGLI